MKLISNQSVKQNYETIDDQEQIEEYQNEKNAENEKSSHKLNKQNGAGNPVDTNNNNLIESKQQVKSITRNQNDFVDVRECLKVTAQTCLVPIIFNLLSTILTYVFICITNSFDSLRIYCFLLSK